MDMTRYSLIRLLVILVLLFAPVIAAKAQRFNYEETTERSFDVRPGQRLTLRSDLGSVRILSGSGNRVEVRVLEGTDRGDRASAQEQFDRFDLDFQQTDEGIEVRGDYDNPSPFNRRSLQVRYEIQVPRTFHVDVETAGGSISLEDLTGNARLNTSGGAVSAKEVRGDVRIQTSGGSVSAERVVGDITLGTSGGGITVSEVKGNVTLNTSGGSITADRVAGNVEAETSGGSIRLGEVHGWARAETSGGSVTAELVGQPDGDVTLSTSGGSVTVLLDSGVRADVNASASGGGVHSDVPIQGEVERGRIRGTLNGGGPRLVLSSSGGGVRIRQR